ncbi:MAG: class I SAM-dependent methyltransferase [Saprospiraceae bacterium]|nr:class I SAM-dependent methyltransferase [Saprospiraceae bacterium]
MNTKEHYDNHLGFFYSWIIGDFDQKKNEFLNFCKSQEIQPTYSGLALDLGAGNGIQSIALAELGFKVVAIDFNKTLLDELKSKIDGLNIETINADFKDISNFSDKNPELIICCGDTLAHLGSQEEIEQTILNIKKALSPEGKFIFSFRDYSFVLTDTMRFIPVKSDAKRIFTCYLEYFESKVRVTDLVYEHINNEWIQKISSYEKVRITKDMILKMLDRHGFNILSDNTINKMITITGQKRV